MTTEDEASKRCCELIRKMHFTEEDVEAGIPSDQIIIEECSDEWGLMMQIWKETQETFSKSQ